jgi:hypothetical protein
VLARLIVLAALVCVPLAAAAQAHAAPIGVAVSDPGGDASDPQLDFQAMQATFDPATGVLEGGITLAAPPTSQVIEIASIELGRSVRGAGYCKSTHDVDIWIPTPEHVAAGLTLPFAELYKGRSSDPIGFLPSSTNGATITFSSATAAPEVLAALKSQPIDCVAGAYTMKAGSLDIDDEIADQPLLSGGRRKPSCKPLKRTVRGGESVPFRCRGAGRKLGVHIFPLRGRDFFTGTERVRNGRFRVPTTRSMRGKTAISLWIGGTVFARFEVKVR